MSDDNTFYIIPTSEHHISLRLDPLLTHCGGCVPVLCSLSTTEMKIALHNFGAHSQIKHEIPCMTYTA